MVGDSRATVGAGWSSADQTESPSPAKEKLIIKHTPLSLK